MKRKNINVSETPPVSIKKNTSSRAFRVWTNRIGALLLLLGIISGIATYAALNRAPPFGDDTNTVIWLLNVDLIILLALVSLVALRIIGVWNSRKRGLAGSQLHIRLIYTFSLLTALPVIIMTVFSALFFHYGVQTWFSERVQTAVNESQAVAESYLDEHKQLIRADTLAMANDIDRYAFRIMSGELALSEFVERQSLVRNLSEAMIFNEKGDILARSRLTFSLEFEQVPDYLLREAEQGNVVLMTGITQTSETDDRVRALVKLDNFTNAYLFVGRMVDPKVLGHLTSTRKASEDYANLQTRYADLQVTLTMMFVMVGVLLLLIAIWFGLFLARQLVVPIGNLIRTAEQVGSGDLSARVKNEQNTLDELDYLASAFNRMTTQLQNQQDELLDANRKIDRRRRFTETVLTGVSSGILGLNEHGEITLANTSALDLLEREDDIKSKSLADILPEANPLLEQAYKQPEIITEGQIEVRIRKALRIFLFRIAVEKNPNKSKHNKSAVVTFDDITDLQAAQRKAAWSDVARRIAHEIKNPLTPIQLSAERLKRKYMAQIQDNPKIFAECTDTIVKHVEDIGRMVTEFSSFARMPEPVFQNANLAEEVRQTLTLQSEAHRDITFEITGLLENKEKPVMAVFDPQLIRQALTNLIKNAIEAFPLDQTQKQINIALLNTKEPGYIIVISDNGPGLPDQDNNLTEPYVTHKSKGTGLGLAIVKKIMEDHKGELVLHPPLWLKSDPNFKDLGGANIGLKIGKLKL